MRDVGRRMATGMAVAALVWLAASGLPALASPRCVRLADGSSLEVWEQHPPAPVGAEESWRINYTFTDAAGARTGVVPPTLDAAADSAPFLALDATGSAVLVWSRSDGFYRKIAYARFAGGNWTNFHYLTFGVGDDDHPRIGTDMTGSYLFYAARPDKYLYAPLELVSGRLFAAPRFLNLGSAHRDIESQRRPGNVALRGGVDAPVTGRHGRVPLAGGMTMQGGTDVPVVTGRTMSSAWGVGSNGDCRNMILVIPTRDLNNVLVFRFANGRILPAARLQLIPQDFSRKQPLAGSAGREGRAAIDQWKGY